MPASEAAMASERREIRNGVIVITVRFLVISNRAPTSRDCHRRDCGIAERASNNSWQFAAPQQTFP
jgi:hypothetical protein